MNLNITEAEEDAIEILEEKLFPLEGADLSEKALTEKESVAVESNLEELEIDLVGGDVEKKLSVWEDDSLWDDLEEEVVWDLGNAEDEDGGGRVYFPVPQLPPLEAPMLDDLPLLSRVEQQGGESRDGESNDLGEEQEVLFVEEDLSFLLPADFPNANQNITVGDDGFEQVTEPVDNENINVNTINSDKIENSPIVSEIFDNNGTEYDEMRNDEVKIREKVTMKVKIIDKDLITKRENGESSKKEEADEDLEMPENAAVIGQQPEEAINKEEGGKAESKAEPRSIGNSNSTFSTSKKVIKTREGLVQGVEGRTDEGRIFHKYLGVPYAAPPLGSLRCNFNDGQPSQLLYTNLHHHP